MIPQTQTGSPPQSSWAGEIWGGLAAMLVALPSSIAFGVLVYTALGREYVGQGAMAGILGAAAIGFVAPFIGRTSGLISAPCAPAAAVLSALIAGLLSAKSGVRLDAESIFPLLALTALFSAALQIFYGAIGGGRLIKYIPYPVVGGYLSGVAVIIALGQLPKLFGLPKDMPLLHGLLYPDLWKWQGLIVGLVTMAVTFTAPRITRKMPAPILGLLSGVIAYFVLSAFYPGLLSLRENPLIIGPIQISGSFFGEATRRVTSLFSVDLASLRLILVPALALSALLSIDTLKTCVALDALTRSRHNSDRELLGQGMGNLMSFFIGGMPGAGAMGPTLVNITSGGRTFRAGVIEGVFVVLSLLFLSRLIAWVPIGALAGILLVVAWRMFDKNMFHLLRYRAGRLDFAVIATVVIVSLTIDLIAASGAGVALAILLFIRDQIRGAVIRRKSYLNQTSSKTRRLAAEREALKQHGDQGVFCELQGNLFFGTTDQLFSKLEEDLRTKRYILLDMRHVQSMDYTAAHLFEQMHGQLAERGGQLLFSGMPSGLLDQRDFERYLAQLGVVRKAGGVMICETLDAALEWMEERVLEAEGVKKKGEERLLELKDFDLFRGFDESMIGHLAGCMRALTIPQGQKVFALGDPGGDLFLVRRGSVRILMPLEGKRRHHLATIGAGDFFGEISFLDRGVRSADAEAKAPTDLYVLSRAEYDEHLLSAGALAAQFFARLALTIAERLRQTDMELRMLEER
ncbi:MAG: SulP family inorganic anion transporter [Candidatus Sumerlaeota bacterium]|nr:SulP family inorganic anion transporter [Candidatus Sumerlaeota bacterium]